MRKLAWLCWPCAAILWASTPSSAQTTKPKQTVQPNFSQQKQTPPERPATATIYGTVTDTLGQPISDALVEISEVSGRDLFSATILRTSETGEFSLDTLVAGKSYTVAVMRFGYRAVETKPFVADGSSPKVLTVVLRPRQTVTLQAKTPPPKTKLIRKDSIRTPRQRPKKAE
jgi:hypothetical protein